MPSGTRLEVSNHYIARVEDVIRSVVKPKDLGMIVSNIGVYPDLSAIFTSNASMDTAFVQTSLKEDHSVGSYEYMRRVQAEAFAADARAFHLFPGRRPGRRRHQSGTACAHRHPDEIEQHGQRLRPGAQLAAQIRTMPNVSSVYIPQDLDYPGIQLNIDRERASLIGLTTQDVVDNVITALTSDGQVAPSYWIDPKTGNNYMVTVQYSNRFLNHMSMEDLQNIPLRGVRPAGYSPDAGRPRGLGYAAISMRGDHAAATPRFSSWPTFK